MLCNRGQTQTDEAPTLMALITIECTLVCAVCDHRSVHRSQSKECKGPARHEQHHHRAYRLFQFERADGAGAIVPCVICGYYAQFRAKGLLKECPSASVSSMHLDRLTSLHHPANPSVLLKEPVISRSAVNDETRPYTSVAGRTLIPTQTI